MSLYSYHIFMFPFQWELNSQGKKSFGERFLLKNLKNSNSNQWINIPKPKVDAYKTELYNEKNFFYKFVHNVLYDEGERDHQLVKHFERAEGSEGNLIYRIGVKANEHNQVFDLDIASIDLDIFSTGTGILKFYLKNTKYKDFYDVRRINQFGRRIFPAFLGIGNDINKPKESELADFIEIQGLNGEDYRYTEDFTGVTENEPWSHARFIHSLIEDLDPDLMIEPVVDDRMFTMCWYLNNTISNQISDSKQFYKFARSDDWHKFLYIDSGDSTCQNDRMQKKLLEEKTYTRWQKDGTLYGVTRHSFMAISNEAWFSANILTTHFRTIYARIVELSLLQRASVLKFSAEVTRLSTLSGSQPDKLAEKLDDFYKAYIQFVNQVYFREITAQDQGIELYEMLHSSMRIKEQVRDLDDEIEELHNYASLLDEKAQSRNIGFLTLIGSLFLIPSFFVGFYGMNVIPEIFNDNQYSRYPIIIAIILVALALPGILWYNRKGQKAYSYILTGFIILVSLAVLFLSFL